MRLAPGLMAIIVLATGTVTADELQEARRLLAERQYIAAEAALREAARNPDLAPEAYYVWYQSLRERGAGPERAARRLEQAAQAAAIRADWWLELGLLFGELERDDDAVRCFTTALAIDPRYGQAHSALARTLLRRGRMAEGRAQLAEAVRVNPAADDDWALLCELVLTQDEPLEALRITQQGLELHPQSVPLRRVAGQVYEQMGESGRALEFYEALTPALPRDADLQMRIGRLHAARGEAQKALEAFGRAARLIPQDAGPPLAAAWLHLEEPRRPQVALEAADHALRLSPNHPEALAARGWALYWLKREADAQTALRAAVATETGSPDAMYFLGFIAHADGDREQAVEWLWKAVALGTGTGAARRAHELLREIEREGREAAPAISPTAGPEG